MKLTNLTIKDLFTNKAKLTFLTGAGCSIDAPSCLPAGRAIMEAIVKYSCAKSEIEIILELVENGKLRFEQLVEIIRDTIDPNLKIIDYYDQCDKPNLQHFFLAEMIKKGHFVMTTNFDFLIEYALLLSNIPEKEIIPVITKKDFENYKSPSDLFNQGKKTVYKIHGSTKNIITGESTKETLKTTIHSLGLGKEGMNIFQVESFKRPLFNNISNDRSLVAIGYSGSDDFDIIPTLKVLKNLQNVIWIYHSKNIEIGKEKIYEIDASTNQSLNKLDNNIRKVTQMLYEIWRMNNVVHVYRVDINTMIMVKELLDIKPKLSPDNFSIRPIDWFNNNIEAPRQIMQYQISYKIYKALDIHEDSMRCSEEIFHYAEKEGDQRWRAISLNNIGLIYKVQGNYPKALKRYEEALKIDEQLGNLSGKATSLNNLASIHYTQGNYLEALKRYEEALKIDEQLGDLSGKAIRLNNIGNIYRAKGNYPKALKRYEEALKINEQLGDLSGKAIRLNNIASIHYAQGNYPEALKRYEEALKIDELLGNISGKAICLNNIGLIYKTQGNYPEALKRYEEALKIDEQLGVLSGKATRLNNIGDIYSAKENYPEALKRYEEALKIDEQLGNISGKAICLNNIGNIYRSKGNYPMALKRYEEALKIAKQLGELSGKAACLNNIASIHYAQGNHNEALKRYEEALKIAEQLGVLSGKAACLNNIASIHYAQGNHNEALKRYEEVLKIANQLGDLSNKTKLFNNIGEIYRAKGNYPKALIYFENALKILTELGFSKSSRANIYKKKIEYIKRKMK